MDEPIPPLDADEVRVLGSLIEKQITTPDYYPLTLNALTNACNQINNRDPVVSLDETAVVRAVDRLREKRLATLFTGQESRVAKYKHALTDALLVTPAEIAVLCALMLRGPQTLGELRTRCERLFAFDTLAEVEETLTALAGRQPQPLTAKLPRQPGTKEPRYAHLLSGAVEISARSDIPTRMETAPPPAQADDARIGRLEEEVATLRRELAELQKNYAEFRRQFE